MSRKIAYFKNWIGHGPTLFNTGPIAVMTDVIPLYALEKTDLASYRALLFPGHVDQYYLFLQRDALDRYLAQGGRIVCNGHIVRPFIRYLRPYEALIYEGLETLRIYPGTPHPIFEGVDREHLTFNHGVAGFYSRGGNPPADGAVVLNTIGPQRTPIDWLLTLPGGGCLLVHSGNDMWMHAYGNNSAARVAPQLINWLMEDVT